jgi:hypothetical protein
MRVSWALAATGAAWLAVSGCVSPPSVAAAGACLPAGLRVELGGRSGTDQVDQVIRLTNSGTAPCAMAGFPGVDLVGVGHLFDPESGAPRTDPRYTWSLARAGSGYRAVTLWPGQAAHTVLTYLGTDAAPPRYGRDTTGQVLEVTTIVLTPPDDTANVSLPWHRYLTLQDGATHPGTFVGPVLAGPGQ